MISGGEWQNIKVKLSLHHELTYCNCTLQEEGCQRIRSVLSDFKISHSAAYRGLLTSSCYGQSPNKQKYF